LDFSAALGESLTNHSETLAESIRSCVGTSAAGGIVRALAGFWAVPWDNLVTVAPQGYLLHQEWKRSGPIVRGACVDQSQNLMSCVKTMVFNPELPRTMVQGSRQKILLETLDAGGRPVKTELSHSQSAA